jgi:Flp pilus assembly protein TadD
MGLLNLLQKRYSAAEQEIRRLYEPGSEDTRAVKALIEIYKAKHVLDNAISMLQEELRRRPEVIELRLLLASTATEAGNLPLAASEYERLRAADPASPQIAAELGHIYLLQGQLEKAVDRFERAEQLAPRDPSPPALLGETLDRLGRKREAMAQYRKSLALKPSSPLVMNNLAYLIAETGGDLEEAFRLASAALRQEPANLLIADTVGWIYLQKRDFTTALQTFQNLVRRDPVNPTLRLHLAMALKSTGKGAAAEAELEAALSSHPSSAEAAKIKDLLEDWQAH